MSWTTSDAGEYFDSLESLQWADHAHDGPEYASVRAVGHGLRSRRRRVQTSVAWPVQMIVDGQLIGKKLFLITNDPIWMNKTVDFHLSFEFESTTRNERFVEQHTHVIDQIPSDDIVGAV